MSSPSSAEITGRRRIIVADEDPKIVEFIITTLRQDGHAVFHAYDGLAATELVFTVGEVHLVIS
jgi:DNA-binding response OmpR family regulator